jgi:hypothetical protein
MANEGPAETDLREDLANYVGVLSQSAAMTSRAEDRAVYMQHLAAAALMFFLLQKNVQRSALERWLDDERRSYGWRFLAGDEGKEAESAFQRFAAAVENTIPAS